MDQQASDRGRHGAFAARRNGGVFQQQQHPCDDDHEHKLRLDQQFEQCRQQFRRLDQFDQFEQFEQRRGRRGRGRCR
ncbi:MAG: hypothetical protein ABSC94_26285 [Polyangiaceae bacterium]